MVVGGAMVGSLFSSDAWNNVTFTAGEVKNPRRNLPLSLVLGTGMVIVLYLLANLAYLAALPLRGSAGCRHRLRARHRPRPGRPRGDGRLEQVAPAGPALMALAIMVSTFGCVNGMILMGARLYYAMARDGCSFSRWAGSTPGASPPPVCCCRASGRLLLVFSGTYSQLLDYVIFAALLFYVLTVVGLFVLRRKRPDVERPYRAFGYPLVPALYVGLCAAIMLDLLIVKPLYTWPGLILVLSGIPVYFWWRAAARRPR